MTTPDPAAAPAPALPPLPSLADLIAFVGTKPDLPPLRRRDLVSALRTAARLFGRDPAFVRAEPRQLCGLFAELSPAGCGISAARLTNIRSLTLAALLEGGIRAMPGRAQKPLSMPWERLRAQLPNARFRNGLSRFMSDCSARGTTPEAVNAATFAAFRKALEGESLNRKPGQVYQTTCMLWNQANEMIAGWPQARATVSSLSRRYSLKWDAFSNSFRIDVEAFLTHTGNQDVLADDYAPSVEPSTIQMRRKQILQLASALVLSGFPIEAIDGLAVLVDPANAKGALRFLLARKNDKTTQYLHQQTQLLRTIARHWVRAKPAEVDSLAKLVRRVSVKRAGMTDKNHHRLRQFDNPANVRALVGLPRRVLNELAGKDAGDRPDALRAMYAVAVRVLLSAPMRIDNLVGLEPERHLLRLQGRARGTTHLLLSAEETKNDVPYELELPSDTLAALDLYLSRYRDRLAPAGSAFLFPNETGGRRSTAVFAQGLCAFILRETGILINAHLFRHLAGRLYLQAHPGDFETVRRLLGHKSLTTTLRSYIDLTTPAAFRSYDAVVKSWLEPQEPDEPVRKPKPAKTPRR